MLAPLPSARFTVPVTAPFTRVVTQTGTPPPEIGSGAPKKNAQAPPPEQSASRVHRVSVALSQRWLSIGVVLWIGPLSAQMPHAGNAPGHASAKLSEPPSPVC